VRLILWHTDTDAFDQGQWFTGRIHGGLSDLSPDGALLLCAAGKWSVSSARARDYGYAWTAISRPPYLTALALWPAARPGAAGGIDSGGGLFVDDQTVLLDHQAAFQTAHPHHLPPAALRIIFPDKPHSGLPDPENGEILPLEFARLTRDGWRVAQRIHFEKEGRYMRLVQPWILERPSPEGDQVLVLSDDHRYVWGGVGREYCLRDRSTGAERALAGVQWADWDQRGRLVFAREGALFTCGPGEQFSSATQLADFSAQTFASISAPAWATQWPERPRPEHPT
jgi:hypothetical protein